MRKRIVVLTALTMAMPAFAAADSLRDPTRPTRELPESAPAAATSLGVSAVFISGERRIAIVNGRRVREGDVVDGATVAAIESNRVEFVREDKTLVVPLLNGATRN